MSDWPEMQTGKNGPFQIIDCDYEWFNDFVDNCTQENKPSDQTELNGQKATPPAEVCVIEGSKIKIPEEWKGKNMEFFLVRREGGNGLDVTTVTTEWRESGDSISLSDGNVDSDGFTRFSKSTTDVITNLGKIDERTYNFF